ncbi:hypothetical protein RUM43_014845 [Polyplax serrata]|uniref:Trichohyalin-plectin-homology domain-containing protein n=1 Tax=Polyplax serrata TaxID=468196 RepID=A0AAN8NYC7_POLSC
MKSVNVKHFRHVFTLTLMRKTNLVSMITDPLFNNLTMMIDFECRKRRNLNSFVTKGIVLSKEEWCRINSIRQTGEQEKPFPKQRNSIRKLKRPKVKHREIKSSDVNLEKITDSSSWEDKFKSERTLREAARLAYEERQTTRKILSALLFSAVLQERHNQLVFNNRIRTVMKQKCLKEKEEYNEKVSQFQMELYKARMDKQRTREHLKRCLNKQLEEKVERSRIEKRQQEMEKELLAAKNVHLARELSADEENRILAKRNLKESLMSHKETEKQIERAKKKSEKKEDQIRKIQLKVAHDMNELKKKKERVLDSEAKSKVIKLHIAMRRKEEKDRQLEAEKLTQVEAEINANNDKIMQGIKHKKERLRTELVKSRTEAEEALKRKDIVQKFARRMECKARESKEEFDKRWNIERKRQAKKNQWRVFRDHEKQEKEVKERKRLEDDMDRKLQINPKSDDEHVTQYCDYMLKEAESHGRPLFPVLKAIKEVKSDCGINRAKRIVDHLKTSFIL